MPAIDATIAVAAMVDDLEGRGARRWRRPTRIRRPIRTNGNQVNLAAWVWFVIACMIGAPVRYVLDGLVQDHTEGVFPHGTWVINVTGSFVLGILTGLALYHGLGKVPKTVLGTGFCGAYTTFSTFTFETVRLAEEGDLLVAARNAAFSLLVGGFAAGAGLILTMI